MKKKLLTVALAAVMVVSSAISSFAADTTAGLVGYYTFDDTLANKAGSGEAKLHAGKSGTAGKWADALVTTGAEYSEGKVGKAFAFKGDGLELDVTMGKAFTVSYWLNPTTAASAVSQVFVPTKDDGGLNIANNWFGTTFPTIRIWGIDGTADVYMDYWVKKADELCKQWSYITVTGDDKGNITLYMNGAVVKQTAGDSDGDGKDDFDKDSKQTAAGAFEGKNIYLGINYWDPTFDGSMDEVTVYNRALSAEEVKALYDTNGVPTAPQTPVGPTTPTTPVVPPTGDATMVGLLLAVAAVSAVVVLKKKTVTE